MKAIYDALFFARSTEMGAAKPGALTAAADFPVKPRLWSKGSPGRVASWPSGNHRSG
jgi:hypothetical protein